MVVPIVQVDIAELVAGCGINRMRESHYEKLENHNSKVTCGMLPLNCK